MLPVLTSFMNSLSVIIINKNIKGLHNDFALIKVESDKDITLGDTFQ